MSDLTTPSRVSPRVLPETPSASPKTMAEITAQNVKSIADLERAAQGPKSFSDRTADRITRFCGSMVFVWVHVVFFSGWIVVNTVVAEKPIDPYPFSFLTLVVSLEAIFLSTFIMIAENRQSRIHERRSHLDLQINLLAEQESTKALELLHQIAGKIGVDQKARSEAEVLGQATHPEKLLEQIDQTVKENGEA